MKQFELFYWWRYGKDEKDWDTITLISANEESAKLLLKEMIPSAFDIKLLKTIKL